VVLVTHNTEIARQAEQVIEVKDGLVLHDNKPVTKG
jgi:ABC-type lipoprotein export system ATPase subunit